MLPLGLIACRAVSAHDLIVPREPSQAADAGAAEDGGDAGAAADGVFEEDDDAWEDDWVIGTSPLSFSRVAVGALLFPYTS